MATLLGGSIAWIVVRTDAPLRGLGYFTAFASFGTPFILYTIGWLLLLGKAGPVNYWLKTLLDQTGPVFNVYSLCGDDFHRSRCSGRRLFFSCLRGLPLHGPVAGRSFGGLRRAALADHAAGFAAPDAAGIFFRDVVDLHPLLRVLRDSRTGRIARRHSRADHVDLSRRAEAAAAVWQRRRVFRAADAGGGGDALSLFSRHARGRSISHDDRQRLPARTDPASAAGVTSRRRLLVFYSVVLLVLPFLIILWASFLPFYMQPSIEALGKFTVKNYITALHFPKITDSIKNSILLGLGSASVGDGADTVRILGSGAHQNARPVAARYCSRPCRCCFPVSSWAWRSCAFICSCRFRSTARLWILLIAFVTRYIPYGIRYTHSGLLQLHKELEEAAYTAGASWVNCMRRIILPLMTPSFLGGWVFIFLLSAKELSMSVLLVSPQTPVVSVAIFELWENAQVGELAAFGVIWTVILVSVAILYYLIARRYGIQN